MGEDGVPAMEKVWDWVVKIVSVLVIPLLAWVVMRERDMAKMSLEIEYLKKDVQQVRVVESNLAVVSTSLVRLETKLDGTDKSLNEIRVLLKGW